MRFPRVKILQRAVSRRRMRHLPWSDRDETCRSLIQLSYVSCQNILHFCDVVTASPTFGVFLGRDDDDDDDVYYSKGRRPREDEEGEES